MFLPLNSINKSKPKSKRACSKAKQKKKTKKKKSTLRETATLNAEDPPQRMYSDARRERWLPTAWLATGSIFFSIDKLRDQAASQLGDSRQASLPRSNNRLPRQVKTNVSLPEITSRLPQWPSSEITVKYHKKIKLKMTLRCTL